MTDPHDDPRVAEVLAAAELEDAKAAEADYARRRRLEQRRRLRPLPRTDQHRRPLP